jgi:hypothetical protein
MKKNNQKVVIAIFSCLTLFFGYVFLHRLNMSYNSEGKYFDTENLITYEEQAVTVYGLIALTAFIIVSILLVVAKSNKN